MLNQQQIYLFGCIQTSQTGGQLHIDTSLYEVSECSLPGVAEWSEATYHWSYLGFDPQCHQFFPVNIPRRIEQSQRSKLRKGPIHDHWHTLQNLGHIGTHIWSSLKNHQVPDCHLNKYLTTKHNGRHSSVVSSASTIMLRPQVRIPSTQLLKLYWEKDENKQKEAGIGPY